MHTLTSTKSNRHIQVLLLRPNHLKFDSTFERSFCIKALFKDGKVGIGIKTRMYQTLS